MITSRDLYCEEPEERNFTSARKSGYYVAPPEPPREIVKVSRKSNTPFGSISTTHTFEAVNAGGVVIRTETFRLPVLATSTTVDGRLWDFRKLLEDEGYEVVPV